MDLTLISQNEYDRIAGTSMTADEAFDYMNRTFPIRTFGEILTRFSGGLDIKKTLTDTLCSYSPNISRDSLSRKIRGWFGGKYEPSDRETYLQLCFALKLDEESAQEFLCYCTDSGFHCRDPRELTYAFALRTGMSYHDAVSLYDSLPQLPETDGKEMTYTQELIDEFRHVSSVCEFRQFYTNNMDKLGMLHNTAYKYFMTFMNCLKDPDAGREDLFGKGQGRSAEISIDRIMQDYIRMNVPADTLSGKYTYIQKIIKKYWPSATGIKNMMNRKEDVTRKVLILLYLVTEGIAPDVNYDFVYDDDLSPEERFGEHYSKLRIMLLECGMSPPDPRNVFDWAALYAVKMNNGEEIRGEMQELISRIFDVAEKDKTK